MHEIFHRHTKTLLYAFLATTIVCFISIAAFKVQQTTWFYSYDPFYHYNIALNNELAHPFASGIPGLGGATLSFDYPTLFRPLTAILSEATGLSLRDIYRYSGVFLRIIASLYMFLVVRRITQREWVAYFAFFTFLFTPYLFYRSLISYPENMVLVFHLMIVYELVKTLEQKRPTTLLFVAIGLSLLVHYRSIVVPLVALAVAFGLLILEHLQRRQLLQLTKRSLLGALLIVLISAPVIVNVVSQYRSYAASNVGSGASLKGVFENTTQYTPFDYSGYQGQIGAVLIALVLLGAFITALNIARNTHRQISIFLLAMSLFTFALTRGQQLKLYIPPIRMFSYFAIFAIPLVGLAIASIEQKISSPVKATIGWILVLTLLIQAIEVEGWVGLDDKDMKLGAQLNTALTSNSVIIWDTYNPVVMGVNKYTLIEPNWLKNKALLPDNQPEPSKGTLHKTYPGKDIVIITGKDFPDYQLYMSSPRINVFRLEAGK